MLFLGALSVLTPEGGLTDAPLGIAARAAGGEIAAAPTPIDDMRLALAE